MSAALSAGGAILAKRPTRERIFREIKRVGRRIGIGTGPQAGSWTGEPRYDFLMRHALGTQPAIEVAASEAELARLIARVERTWTALGAMDPHWSVITQEQYRADTIGQTAEAFYATGAATVARLRAALRRQGVELGKVGRVIDFGCGVGRLSSELARQGCEVVAVDLSEAHLDVARRHFAAKGLAVETRRLAKIGDLDALPSAGLVYSVIVLQHNPPPVMAEVLRRLLARVGPGGHAFFQVPTFHARYRYSVAEDLARETQKMEMHVLPQPDVFRILDAAGFRPLEVCEDDAVGDPAFGSHSFFAERTRAATPPAPEAGA